MTLVKQIQNIHIDTVKVGDIILCPDGMERTLTPEYLKRDGFMGTTIWGDSYRLGIISVKRVDMVEQS